MGIPAPYSYGSTNGTSGLGDDGFAEDTFETGRQVFSLPDRREIFPSQLVLRAPTAPRKCRNRRTSTAAIGAKRRLARSEVICVVWSGLPAIGLTVWTAVSTLNSIVFRDHPWYRYTTIFSH